MSVELETSPNIQVDAGLYDQLMQYGDSVYSDNPETVEALRSQVVEALRGMAIDLIGQPCDERFAFHPIDQPDDLAYSCYREIPRTERKSNTFENRVVLDVIKKRLIISNCAPDKLAEQLPGPLAPYGYGFCISRASITGLGRHASNLQ
jgi:hypothetical protein